MNKLILKSIFVVLIIYSMVNTTYALSVETHEEINGYIVQNTLNGFSLDAYLKNQVAFEKGIDEVFNSLTVWRWLRRGGRYEDLPAWYLPYLRSVNHFHNPLKPLDQAGFTGIWGTGLLSGKSAILWSQNAKGTQSPGGFYSWYDVRGYFYDALTSANQNTRDTSFANTFRGLGQLMHLVEDMSVPEHARNDGHYADGRSKII